MNYYTMFRFFPIIVCFCTLLFMSPFAADAATPSSASSVCDGRYAVAAEILQAMKYSTLYSGCFHFSRLDDVGQTVDMYRFWRGSPDWNLRSAGGHGAHEYIQSGGNVTFDWLVGSSLESGRDKAEISAVVHTLDINAAVTRPADAWLDDEQNVQLSSLELWLRFVMTASDAPWAIFPIFYREYALETGFLRLRDEALRRYQSEEGIEWAVAALLLDPLQPSMPLDNGGIRGKKISEKAEEIDRIFYDWEAKVLSCAATPQEYAAWAAAVTYRKPTSGRLQEYQRFLPDKIFRLLTNYWSRWSVGGRLLSVSRGTSLARNSSDDSLITDIAKYIDDPGQSAWLGAGLSFSLVRDPNRFTERDMDRLLTQYKGQQIHSITAARFNMLSSEHLLRLAREGELSGNMRCSLISAAFARYVTDGVNAAAFSLIDELLPCFPESTRTRLEAIARRDASLEVKNALFSLSIITIVFLAESITVKAEI